jgi:hypothetical protein
MFLQDANGAWCIPHKCEYPFVQFIISAGIIGQKSDLAVTGVRQGTEIPVAGVNRNSAAKPRLFHAIEVVRVIASTACRSGAGRRSGRC